MELHELFTGWTSLVGFAALIAVMINVLKLTGVVKDGSAQIWSAGLNLAGLIVLFVLKVFRPEMDLAGIDQQVGELANVAMVLIGYITQLLSSKLTHTALKNVPVVGKSYASEAAKIESFRAQMVSRG